MKELYAARISVIRETVGDIARFGARIVFADGFEITKFIEGPADRKYNPNDDAILIRAYPVVSTLLKNGDTVYFDGCVSDGLLAALYTVNQNYHSAFNNDDKLYHMINVVAKKEVPVKPMLLKNDAIIAYSGGVDASHLLLSHKMGVCGARNVNIKTAIMFSNIEVRHQDPDKQRRKFEICRESLKEFDVDLVMLSLPDEEQGYMRYKWNLIAGIYLFANTGEYNIGLLGSNGHNPTTLWACSTEESVMSEREFSTPAMSVRSDGGTVTRTEKCRLLAQSDILMKNLMVCFDTDYTHPLNCGVCPKCVRTKLNFWASGIKDLPSFSSLGGGR